MTGKQRRFITEYVIDQNATEAAKRAGYKVSRATHSQGYDLLQKPEIKAEIERVLAELRQKTQITLERQLAEYDKIKNLAEKDTDKLHALDSQSKLLGLFIERSDVRVKVGRDLGDVSDEELSRMIESAKRAAPVLPRAVERVQINAPEPAPVIQEAALVEAAPAEQAPAVIEAPPESEAKP